RVDEARQFGLAADDLLGLAPNACPNRINRIERRLCLILRHSTLSRTPGGLNPGHLAYIGTRSGETKACGGNLACRNRHGSSSAKDLIRVAAPKNQARRPYRPCLQPPACGRGSGW